MTINVTSIAANVLNPYGLIPIVVGVLGLTGTIPTTGAAGVALGFGIFSFMIGSASCCAGGISYCKDRNPANQ